MIIGFDCESGVSGDMLVGALIDLGADENYLKNKLKSLKIGDFDVKINKLCKKGRPATDFDVVLKEYNPDHDMNYLYGENNKSIEIKNKRNITEVKRILENSTLNKHEKEISMGIFEIIADAEAKAHGININDVIFHENGAMDSIIDIVSFALCIENLNVQKVFVKNLTEGQGNIRTRVGLLPVPTPAVENITRKFNIKYEKINFNGELITPTGIGALAFIGDFSYPKQYKILKTGYGAGKRDYETSCTLRVDEIQFIEAK